MVLSKQELFTRDLDLIFSSEKEKCTSFTISPVSHKPMSISKTWFYNHGELPGAGWQWNWPLVQSHYIVYGDKVVPFF